MKKDCWLLNIWNYLSDTAEISIGTYGGYRLRETQRKRNIDTSSTGGRSSGEWRVYVAGMKGEIVCVFNITLCQKL